ncbi:hypothetical protein C2E23DRAFT_823794 [Lenzites betulinus]|nr:hypothetical protein C2E23DRAFT_823794 [Lenzites betulinus]
MPILAQNNVDHLVFNSRRRMRSLNPDARHINTCTFRPRCGRAHASADGVWRVKQRKCTHPVRPSQFGHSSSSRAGARPIRAVNASAKSLPSFERGLLQKYRQVHATSESARTSLASAVLLKTAIRIDSSLSAHRRSPRAENSTSTSERPALHPGPAPLRTRTSSVELLASRPERPTRTHTGKDGRAPTCECACVLLGRC